MSHLIPGFQRNFAGRIVHRYFDSTDWPYDGWYDSPDKVPGSLPGQEIGGDVPPAVCEPMVAPKSSGPIYGERTQAQQAHEQAIDAPRKGNGRFKKGRR